MVNVYRGISDDIMALERMSNVYCGPGEGIMIGPKVILYDVIRAKSWDLLMLPALRPIYIMMQMAK